MRRKTMVIMCAFLLTTPLLCFAEEKGGFDSDDSEYELADEHGIYQRQQFRFKNLANKEIRNESLDEKGSAEEKMNAEKAQDKGEGQVKVKF